jgi:hypothetical protein
MKFPLLNEFVAFIAERWAIHQRRLKGKEPPWTDDPILQRFKFTNVRREDDRVTRWIHENWLQPHQDDLPGAVFAMCMARLVNLPAALEALGYPERWNAARFTRIMEARKAAGLRVFNAAYIVNSVGGVGRSKARHLGEVVLPACWKARESVARALEGDERAFGSLKAAHERLQQVYSIGAFMSAQVLADLKWTPVGLRTTDWYTFAAWGPGSRRGLNRLRGVSVESGKSNFLGGEAVWLETLLELRRQVLPLLPAALRKLDAQNLQSCLCEYSKYAKVVDGSGKPKQLFKPREGSYCE